MIRVNELGRPTGLPLPEFVWRPRSFQWPDLQGPYSGDTPPQPCTEGLRHIDKLPEKVRDAALEFISGPISDNPNRLGKPLVGELEGFRSARRGDYRIIHETLETTRSF